MSIAKMTAIIEMDAKQYQREVVKVEQSTEKMAKTATKSINKWEQESKRVGRRIREHLSLAAIVGVGFAIANRIVNGFFNMIGKGISDAINNNEKFKTSFENIGSAINRTMESLGRQSLPILEKLAKFSLKIINPIAASMPLGMTEEEIKGTMANIVTRQQNPFNTKEEVKYLKLQYAELMDQLIVITREKDKQKVLDEKAKRNAAEKLRIEKLETQEKVNQEKVQRLYDQLLEYEDRISKEKVENQKELNELIKGTSGELTDLIINGSVLAKQFMDSASAAFEMGQNLIKINELIQKGSTIDFSNQLAIVIDIAAIIISIFESLITIKDNEEDLQITEDRINAEIEYRRDLLEEINRLTNNAILQAELDLKLGADKKKQIEDQKIILETYNKALIEEQEIINKSKGLGTQADAQSALNKARTELKGLKEKQKNMNIIEQILFGTYIQALINDKQALVSKLEINLALIKAGNQAETEKLQTLIDIEDTKTKIAELEGTITDTMAQQTEELEKQLDLMKGLVGLGLDLENIRVVKQLGRSLEAQGYTGVNLGTALQDIGVQNRNISGKTLNIFGDINNTLNQGTGNMLISQMNNLINNIGGV